MRGSLRSATADETVRCSGRDDAFGGNGEEQATASAKAGPSTPLHARARAISLRMTPQGKGWEKRTTAKAKYGGLSTAQRTVGLSVAPVEMTLLG